MDDPTYSAPLPYPGDASACFAAIADLPWAIWLDSAGRGRYDILCARPVATLVTHGNETVITDENGDHRSTADPFDLLRRQLGATVGTMPGIPFAGGAVGYWGYDLARRFTALPQSAQDAEDLPEMAVGIYDWAVVIDHQEKTAQLVSHRRMKETVQVLPQILARLSKAGATPQHEFRVHGDIRSNLDRGDYQAAFAAIQHYLHEGDCYQVNLARRYAAKASGDALQTYLELRHLSPAPYSAFLILPQAQILSSSPERFLQVCNGMVETRPIKGTRPRMADPLEDARMAGDLRSNDLGKSCIPGSVNAPRLFEVESYANVHHLVSTVTGQLAPGQDALALLRNCFPGGSITGAPKQRAMEIIEQLEPDRRGVYCGAIGYAGFDGNMDTNIAIRTLVYADGEVRFWAGGGIVADSVMADEYQETLDKAAAMLGLLEQFGGRAAEQK